MGAMKALYMERQQEFAIYCFIKDGCPADEAEKESWESMVENLFDGDEAAAFDGFYIYIGRET